MGTYNNIGIGKKIKELRQEMGITQMELALKMGYTSRAAICKVEKGDDNMTPDRVERFAKALNTTPTHLVGWDVEKTDLTFTKDEQEIIVEYRKADFDTQAMVRRLLSYAKRMSNED